MRFSVLQSWYVGSGNLTGALSELRASITLVTANYKIV